AELHNLLGKYLAAREKELGVEDTCVLTAAYRAGVPCYVSSPGDSSIGMNIAELAMRGVGPKVDVSRDVNETAGIVYWAKQEDGRSGILMLGGGSPKNFVLQTEPQIQEILGLKNRGHDYYIQITDARPDTGGLSGATPSEAVSWGKVDPDKLGETGVGRADSQLAGARPPGRLPAGRPRSRASGRTRSRARGRRRGTAPFRPQPREGRRCPTPSRSCRSRPPRWCCRPGSGRPAASRGTPPRSRGSAGRAVPERRGRPSGPAPGASGVAEAPGP